MSVARRLLAVMVRSGGTKESDSSEETAIERPEAYRFSSVRNGL